MNQAPIYDESLRKSFFLPNGTSATLSEVIDSGVGPEGAHKVGLEFHVEAPELATGQLPDGETVVYHVESSDTADFAALKSSNIVGTQTGAAGAGAAAGTFPHGVHQQAARYWRAKAVHSGAANLDTLIASVAPVLPNC